MILGLDFDTRAVHAVLLDDDTNAARYVPIPFSDRGKSVAFRLEDARDVREAFLDAICRSSWIDEEDGFFRKPCPPMETVWLVGVEKPYSQNKDSSWKYGLVVGAVLACIPASVCVVLTPPQEWKALTVGKANASKDEVREWVCENASAGTAYVADGLGAWPQDAFDAYCIARAVRSLNQAGIEAA